MVATSANSAVAELEDRILVIERVFDAPRDLVWRAFTDLKMARQWMGPRDHPSSSMEGDLRVGGKWRGVLRAADGSGDLGQGGEYREIEEPEKLVFTFKWDDRPNDPGRETVVTVLLEEKGDKTRMIFRQELFNTKANRDGHGYGWNSTFDRLAEFLEKEKA